VASVFFWVPLSFWSGGHNFWAEPFTWIMFACVVGLFTAPALYVIMLRVRVKLCLQSRRSGRGKKVIAFLHPYCNDGGGGERVLWVAIRELIMRGVLDPNHWDVIVYHGDDVSDREIAAHAKRRFGVEIPAAIQFVHLRRRGWIEPKRYPVATLLGQAFGSCVLAAEAIWSAPPDVLVDTTGLHFCLPLMRLAGVPQLAAYVHYPLVSSDMLGAVKSRKAAHNNASLFARFKATAMLKLAYYQVLVFLYRRAGRMSDCTIANGSWTAAHLRSLWGVRVQTVFPPCDTRTLRTLPLEPPGGREHLILSVAQFRPEKDHQLQLKAFGALMRAWRAAGDLAPGALEYKAIHAKLRPRLVLAGAVRHAADQARLDQLKSLAAKLLMQDADAVTFAPNLPYPELQQLLGRAKVGLHTMWNEHFGIGVVEMLAAGVVCIAHNSGGPALDIIDDRRTGRLATTEQEYADAMADLLLRPGAEDQCKKMAAAGRASVSRFSEEAFADGMVEAMRPIVGNEEVGGTNEH